MEVKCISELYQQLSGGLIAGHIEEVKRFPQKAVERGMQGSEILEKGLLPGMDAAGSTSRG